MMDGSSFTTLQREEEVPFALEELFYSRTDGRGVIVAGNAVFQRISCYPWDALIGAPHRIVRHPGTPKAVFRLLWTLIKAGEPAVAYVCNRAADGRPYWVLATVLPYEGGYLSIRLKPSSPLFAAVRDLYARLSAEEAEGLSIEDSVASITEAVRAHGHADYPAFMRAALWAEFTARASTLGQATGLPEEIIGAIRQGLSDSMASQRRLDTEFEGMRILPTNLSIMAARQEPEGGPLGAVASLYMAGTLETLGKISTFTSGKDSLCNRMSESFEKSVFMVVCACLQREMAARLPSEDWAGSGLDPAVEVQYLAELGRAYDLAATTAMDEACDLATAIEKVGAELRRAVLSLETVTVMGKVEGSRLGPEGDRIRTTIDMLHLLNAEISSVLGRIGDLSATVDRGMKEIRKSFDEGGRRG